MVLSLISVFSPSINAIESKSSNYVIEGDVVYIDDDRAYIAVCPHTSSGGWVYLNFTSKKYEGEIDLVFGFDSSVSKPERIDLYKPRNISRLRKYVLPERYFLNTTYYKYNFTFSSQNTTFLIDGTFWLWTKINRDADFKETVLEDWILVYSHDYEVVRKDSKTAFWHAYEYSTWLSITDRLDWKKRFFDFRGMDTWFLTKNLNIKKNRQYHCRIWLNVIPSIQGEKMKYWVAFKPSDETLYEARYNGRLYYLDPWWNSNWGYARKITINSSDIDSDLTNFPVLVYLNSSRIDWTKVQDDLDDLRFVWNDNSTVLKYEIEDYSANDDAWIWVKVDASSISDTEFFMYYGNPGATSGEDAENVWDSNFIMVQHLKDETASTILDSTQYDNDGSKKGANEPQGVSIGMIDDAQEFDGANDYIYISDNPFDFDRTDPFTVEAWINTSVSGRYLLGKVLAASPYTGYAFLMGVNKILMRLVNTWATNVISVYVTVTLEDGNWHHVAASHDGTSLASGVKIYIDGQPGTVVTEYDTLTQPILNDLNFDIGRFAGGGYFSGIEDELRVSNNTRSSAWVKATYESGRDDLLTFGPEQFIPPQRYLLVYFESGLTVYVNGTQRPNATEVSFVLNEVANFTTVVSDPSYEWLRHEEGATRTLENPFFITMGENRTAWSISVYDRRVTPILPWGAYALAIVAIVIAIALAERPR